MHIFSNVYSFLKPIMLHGHGRVCLLMSVYFSVFLCRTPWFNGWGFNLPRGQSLLDKWNLIPEGIDILMTHGPPLGESN